MTQDQFFSSLQSGKIARVYFFYGAEQFIKRRALETLRAALLPEGFEALNETVFEGVSATAIIEAAETLPFMCDRRLVTVYDWAPIMPGKSRDEATETERMTKWLDRSPDSCCLVFFMRDQIDGRKKMTATLKKQAEAIEFQFLDDVGIGKWANQHLRESGKRMEQTAITQLTFMAGRALSVLYQELGKLAAYVGDRAEITVRDVENVVTPSTECTVFQMIDSVLEHKPLVVQKLLKNTLENGETRIGILAMLTRQMRILTHIRLLSDRRIPLAEIERTLELNHYAAQRSARQATRFSPEGLEKAYRACVEADYSIKSGRVREAAALDSLLFLLDRLS